MRPLIISGANSVLDQGSPTGSLYHRAMACLGDGISETAWKPTPDELKVLNDGGVVILSVIGQQVPASLNVADSDGHAEVQ